MRNDDDDDAVSIVDTFCAKDTVMQGENGSKTKECSGANPPPLGDHPRVLSVDCRVQKAASKYSAPRVLF